MKKTLPEELLAHGVHLGHKRTRVHPKSKPYIYAVEGGASIIDLFQTVDLLARAEEAAYKLGHEGKVLMFVGTKKSAREVLLDLTQDNELVHLASKWVGGFLTNFEQIEKNIKTMTEMRVNKETGEWAKLPKHESIALDKKLARIASIYSGVSTLEKIPDALFVIDIRKEATAIEEARTVKIETIAITDTNTDPTLVDFPIPGNDDAVTSIKFITERIVNAYVDGRKKGEIERAKVKKETKTIIV